MKPSVPNAPRIIGLRSFGSGGIAAFFGRIFIRTPSVCAFQLVLAMSLNHGDRDVAIVRIDAERAIAGDALARLHLDEAAVRPPLACRGARRTASETHAPRRLSHREIPERPKQITLRGCRLAKRFE